MAKIEKWYENIMRDKKLLTKPFLSVAEKDHVTLANSKSDVVRKDKALVDSSTYEKQNMLKMTCVPRSNCEKNFEVIDNNKHRTRLESFAEDEEIEEESTATFDPAHEKYSEVETHSK